MKPPMPYYGGKQRIADRIVATFPDHLHLLWCNFEPADHLFAEGC